MKGHIRRRGKNSWQLLFDGAPRGRSGKRHQRWETVRGTKRDAQRRLREILSAIDTGTYVEPTQMTVAEYLQRWLEDYARSRVSGQTLERYTQIVRAHLIPALGHYPMSKLQPVNIQDYYTKALRHGRKDGQGGLSSTTVLQHHRVLRKALQSAVKLQLILRNAADAVDPPAK